VHQAAATALYPDLATNAAPSPAVGRLAKGKLGTKTGEGFPALDGRVREGRAGRYERDLADIPVILKRTLPGC